jgi:hypothetical protein
MVKGQKNPATLPATYHQKAREPEDSAPIFSRRLEAVMDRIYANTSRVGTTKEGSDFMGCFF